MHKSRLSAFLLLGLCFVLCVVTIIMPVAVKAASFFGLGDLPGGDFGSAAYSVSADGSVVVGNGTSGSGTEAFRWTNSGGMVGLGDLPGGFAHSETYGVSGDGSVVVGIGRPETGVEAVRWTNMGGLVGLGDFSGGGTFSYAHGVSADGSWLSEVELPLLLLRPFAGRVGAVWSDSEISPED